MIFFLFRILKSFSSSAIVCIGLKNEKERYPYYLNSVFKETQTLLTTTFMTIDSHKRTLAIIHITVGFLKLFFFACLSLFFSSFKPFIENKILEEEATHAAWIIDLSSTGFFSIMILVIVFSVLPSIIGGIATLKNKSFGMVLLVIAGCLSLLSFPIGTAIGAYSIYVFVENQRSEKAS